MSTNEDLERLRTNGYHAQGELLYCRDPQGWYHRDGDPYDQRTPLNTPPNIAIFGFDAVARSPFADGFVAKLVKLLAPPGSRKPRPLIRLRPAALHAIFSNPLRQDVHLQGVVSSRYGVYPNGLRFTDRPGTEIAQLACGLAPLELDAGDLWLNDKSPRTTPRGEIARYDREGLSVSILALVDQGIAAGELAECEPYRDPRAVDLSRPVYGEPSLDDPAEWDLMDPRHNIPGAADEARRRRREAGLPVRPTWDEIRSTGRRLG